MAKTKPKTFFLCRNCGSMHAKWMGKCPDCGTWDSLEETAKATDDPHRPRALMTANQAEHQADAGHYLVLGFDKSIANLASPFASRGR